MDCAGFSRRPSDETTDEYEIQEFSPKIRKKGGAFFAALAAGKEGMLKK